VADIGFVGLGIMGRAMARNLMKAGHALIVYDFVTDAREALVRDGASRAESAKDAAARSEKVALPITSLVQQMLMALMTDGKGDLDHSAIVNFIEALAKTEIGRPA